MIDIEIVQNNYKLNNMQKLTKTSASDYVIFDFLFVFMKKDCVKSQGFLYYLKSFYSSSSCCDMKKI